MDDICAGKDEELSKEEYDERMEALEALGEEHGYTMTHLRGNNDVES